MFWQMDFYHGSMVIAQSIKIQSKSHLLYDSRVLCEKVVNLVEIFGWH